ncbi:MAG: hypothetical protein ABEJ78_11930 [Haloferacaceae archaeon]
MSTHDPLQLTPRNLLYALSPVGCFVEAVSIGLLFLAIGGCFAALVV